MGALGLFLSFSVVALVIAHYAQFQQNVGPAIQVPVAVVVALLSFLMVSTVRYRTFKDAHLSLRSFAVLGLMVLTGLAIAIKTRPSFVLVVYMLAYIAVGLAETIFIRARPPATAELPAAVRAELEADEALELDDEDEEKDDKPEGDEYI
jgi:CDP-diacylglycerol--serine O-phosphatidyltransferase